MILVTGLFLVRLIHNLAASILFGAAVFPLYATTLPLNAAYDQLGWLRRMMQGAALATLLSATLWFGLEVAGRDGFPAMLWRTDFGRISAMRLALAAIVMALLLRAPTRIPARTLTAGAALLVVGLAALGHAAAGHGAVAAIHIVADAIHLAAASIWIGALVAFLAALAFAQRSGRREDTGLAHDALARFSDMGTIVVVALIFTGLMNPNVLASFGTVYGQVLLAKLACFTAMLGLAAANRFLLTPRLHASIQAHAAPDSALRALKLSIVAETLLVTAVMAAVAVLALLMPPAG